MSKHVLHFSVGTFFFFLCCSGVVGGCLIAAALIIASHDGTTQVESVDELPRGELGPISRDILSRKMSSEEMEASWGPLNSRALTETKQGWLMDRIRARRSTACRVQSRPSYRQVQRSYTRSSLPYQPTSIVSQRCVPCSPASSDPNLPSPMPVNPMVPVTPIDVTPFVPSLPTPDISSLPKGIVPSVKSNYCEDGNCP